MKTLRTLIAGVGTNVALASTAFAAVAKPPVSSPTGDTSFGALLVTVINSLLLFAGAVAVLFLIIGGFRYVVSAGNPDQVEGAKKTILYAVLGLVIIFIAFLGVQVVQNALGVNNTFKI
jgi:hypothetical protein